jgi:hypothetical protein
MLQLFKNRSGRAFVPIIADQAVCVADCRISRSIFPSALGLPREAPNQSRPSPVASAPARLVEPCGSIDIACRVIASAG